MFTPFQALVLAVNRFNPIRLIDKRCVMHYRRNIARCQVLTSVAFQYDQPKIVGRWTSTYSSKSTVNITPVFQTALTYGNKIAIKDELGEYSYEQLFNGATKISLEISKICGKIQREVTHHSNSNSNFKTQKCFYFRQC